MCFDWLFKCHSKSKTNPSPKKDLPKRPASPKAPKLDPIKPANLQSIEDIALPPPQTPQTPQKPNIVIQIKPAPRKKSLEDEHYIDISSQTTHVMRSPNMASLNIASPTITSKINSQAGSPTVITERGRQSSRIYSPNSVPILRAESILIVDGNQKHSQKLKDMLINLGFNFLEIRSCTESDHALKLCAEQYFHLIIMECDNINGVELMQKIRQDGKNKNAKIIGQSLKNDTEMQEFIIKQAKMDSYLSKHYDRNDIIISLQKLGFNNLPDLKYLQFRNHSPQV